MPQWEISALVGRYVTESGVPVMIGQAGAALWARISGLPPVIFADEGAGRFVAAERGLAIEFRRAAEFVLTQPGRPSLSAVRAV